jgi:hypothetical protein
MASPSHPGLLGSSFASSAAPRGTDRKRRRDKDPRRLQHVANSLVDLSSAQIRSTPPVYQRLFGTEAVNGGSFAPSQCLLCYFCETVSARHGPAFGGRSPRFTCCAYRFFQCDKSNPLRCFYSRQKGVHFCLSSSVSEPRLLVGLCRFPAEHDHACCTVCCPPVSMVSRQAT